MMVDMSNVVKCASLVARGSYVTRPFQHVLGQKRLPFKEFTGLKDKSNAFFPHDIASKQGIRTRDCSSIDSSGWHLEN